MVVRILFKASSDALTCSSVAESIILPCLRVALRLSRVDSELTVIETRSVAEGTVDGSISQTASSGQVGSIGSDGEEESSDVVDQFIQENMDGNMPVQSRVLQSNCSNTLPGYDQNDTNSLPVVQASSPTASRETFAWRG